MLGLSLEDVIKTTRTSRSFDDFFFDFSDQLYPWSTVYRFFFLTDLESRTQLMLGIGQKRSSEYWVNGRRTEFSGNGASYRLALTYWVENHGVRHETKNEVVNVLDGISSSTFSFRKMKQGYELEIAELSTTVKLLQDRARSDYVRYLPKLSPFYRYNKYLPFTGVLHGSEVEKGFAFIQKVNLHMPFIPWRWGRVFFEDGSQLDFYEPRIVLPLFRSINFETLDERLEFKLDQRISFDSGLWTISGSTPAGERLRARIRSYARIEQVFETRRSAFSYVEMPSKLEELEIKRGSRTLYSSRALGACSANCEIAGYTRISPLSWGGELRAGSRTSQRP